MAITLDEWNALTQEIIANASDQAQLTALLNKATTNYSELTATEADLAGKNKTLVEEAEKLRVSNLALFTELGDYKAASQRRQEAQDGTTEKRAENITFDDLFKEE